MIEDLYTHLAKMFVSNVFGDFFTTNVTYESTATTRDFVASICFHESYRKREEENKAQ